MKIVADIEILPNGQMLAWFYRASDTGELIGPYDPPGDWPDELDVSFLRACGVEIKFNNRNHKGKTS